MYGAPCLRRLRLRPCTSLVTTLPLSHTRHCADGCVNRSCLRAGYFFLRRLSCAILRYSRFSCRGGYMGCRPDNSCGWGKDVFETPSPHMPRSKRHGDLSRTFGVVSLFFCKIRAVMAMGSARQREGESLFLLSDEGLSPSGLPCAIRSYSRSENLVQSKLDPRTVEVGLSYSRG